MKRSREPAKSDVRNIVDQIVSTNQERHSLLREIAAGVSDVVAGRVVSDDELRRHFESRFGAIEWS